MIDRSELEARPYIASFDGLRALGILSLIGYTLFPYRFSGGFLGADIFLFLSGYFMTASLMTSLMKKGKVPLKNLLWVRFRRSFFPMLAMMALVMVYVTFFQRSLLINLRGDYLSSLFFVNNWWQLGQIRSISNPFFMPSVFGHLWLLSLALQFYVLWPIIFVFLSTIFKRQESIFWAILVLVGLSLLAIFYYAAGDKDLTRIFYGLDSRSLTGLVGALTALVFPIDNFYQQKHLSYLDWAKGGLAFGYLVAALLLYHDQAALTYQIGLVTLGLALSFFLVYALPSYSPLSLFFRLKPITFIGRRSLSYYLWFYPILVLYQERMGDTSLLGNWDWIFSLIIILVMGELWYQLFERRGGRPLLTWFQVATTKAGYVVKPRALLVSLATILVLVGLQTTNGLSDQEAQLNATIEQSLSLAKMSQVAGQTEVKTINNIPGLSREQAVFSSTAKISFLGDELLLSTLPEFSLIYPNAVYAGERGLQLYESKPLVKEIQAKLLLGDYVVLILGNNGAFTNSQLDSLLKEIGMDKQIFLVTTRVHRTWKDQVNQAYDQAAKEYANVHVLDWASQSAQASDWYEVGQNYPNQVGAQAFAKFIGQEVYQALRN